MQIKIKKTTTQNHRKLFSLISSHSFSSLFCFVLFCLEDGASVLVAMENWYIITRSYRRFFSSNVRSIYEKNTVCMFMLSVWFLLLLLLPLHAFAHKICTKNFAPIYWRRCDYTQGAYQMFIVYREIASERIFQAAYVHILYAILWLTVHHFGVLKTNQANSMHSIWY